jgi:hypothetical protein
MRNRTRGPQKTSLRSPLTGSGLQELEHPPLSSLTSSTLILLAPIRNGLAEPVFSAAC